MEIHCDYKNARTINYNRWSEHKQVDKLIQDLVAGIESNKQLGYIKNMKVLVMDLYHSHLTDPEQYLSYYRDKNHYDFQKRHKKGDRSVANPYISYDYFIGSVKFLIAEEYISNKPGQNFYNEDEGMYGFLPKMRATPKLVGLWRKYGLTPDMIGQWKKDDDVEVIQLKAKTIKKKVPCTRYKKIDGVIIKKAGTKTIKIKKPLKVRETAETKRMSNIIHAYNRLMDNTHIDCDAACISDKDRADLIEKLKSYDEKEPVIRLRLNSKHVYRVFNEGDKTFTHGGRYYGAWWVGCQSELRKYITLNGNPTVELDYSGIHIHLLYALEGINYAEKNDYPYNLICTLPDKDPDYKFNKLILLTALNAENDIKARDSVFAEMRNEKKLFKYNLKDKKPITRKLELLKEKHAPIKDYIASGMGLKLQYYDSCVIEKLIGYAVRMNMPVLTVHDSVICEAKNADLIRDKMYGYFTDVIREKMGLSIRHISNSPHAKAVFRRESEERTKYKLPTNSWLKLVQGQLLLSRAVVKTWLTPDALIEIKPDKRTNECSKSCNYSKRLSLTGKQKRMLYRTITVELSNNKLRITD